jgi:hypothetical protein
VTVLSGLVWTVFGLLVVVALVFGVEATAVVAGAIARIVGWLLGAAYGILCRVHLGATREAGT